MTGLLYTVLVGIPLCVMLMAIGVVLCVTVIGIPFGLTCFALATKVLTLGPRVVVR